MKILFILKRSHYYHTPPDPDALSTGLYTSCRLIVDMLTDHGFQASLVIVTDNNDIDRVVNRIKPDVVIIEALWVVPSKFKILKQLYPKVIWVVRIHSDFPFLAHEGMAMGWIYDYFRLGVMVAANSEHVTQVLGRIVYLPNYYPVPKHVPKLRKRGPVIRFGCFGAIRQLKNNLTQALAAIRYAEDQCKPMEFHINSGRIEGNGDPLLKNLVSLFANQDPNKYRLVIHPWMKHDQFLDLLRSMTVGLQVSLSETFNIVAADGVCVGLPMVMSGEIPWAKTTAHPTSVLSISEGIYKALKCPVYNVRLNIKSLREYSARSVGRWLETFEHL